MELIDLREGSSVVPVLKTELHNMVGPSLKGETYHVIINGLSFELLNFPVVVLMEKYINNKHFE